MFERFFQWISPWTNQNKTNSMMLMNINPKTWSVIVSCNCNRLPVKQKLITKPSCLLTYLIKHLQISNLHTISTIVFHFRHILFLHNLLIHLFSQFHKSVHPLAKGLSVSSVHDCEIHSLRIPGIRILHQISVPGANRVVHGSLFLDPTRPGKTLARSDPTRDCRLTRLAARLFFPKVHSLIE